MTPHAQAIAYRIWAYANPRGWDCTMAECADAIGVSPQLVGRIANAKKWETRFRVNPATGASRGMFFGAMSARFFADVAKMVRGDAPRDVELPE